MSSPFSKLITTLKEYKASIPEQIRLVIVTNDYVIADMNAQDQLFEKGIDRNGDSIASYRPYKPLTIEIKRLKGQPVNRVTLRDEGDFHASFQVIANDTSFFIDATDSKTLDLIRKYGEQIMGLTDENVDILVWQYIYPDLLTALKQQL